MSDLLDELKEEHKEILDALNTARNLGTVSDEGQKALIGIKSYLLNHIKKEDELLYPFLYKKAKGNKDLQRILKIFASNMDNISQIIMDFFSKYSKGASGLEFARDVGKILAKLSQRISKEENVIFEKYNELKKKDNPSS